MGPWIHQLTDVMVSMVSPCATMISGSWLMLVPYRMARSEFLAIETALVKWNTATWAVLGIGRLASDENQHLDYQCIQQS